MATAPGRPSEDVPRRARVAAVAGAALVAVAMLGPPLHQPPRDSYPLSTYPMFSRDRGPVSTVATVVGRTADGAVERLSPELIGGTDEVMLAVDSTARAVRAGPARATELCEQVAARVAAGSGRDAVDTVEVRLETYDAVAWFADRVREPTAVDVRATCEVHRDA